jgi:hypothetical protein
MKILVNGNEVPNAELSCVLHDLTDIEQFHSFSALQKLWCRCEGCEESIELNTPMSALDFVHCHRKCDSIVQIHVSGYIEEAQELMGD